MYSMRPPGGVPDYLLKDYIDSRLPSTITNRTKVLWRCDLGHEYLLSLANRKEGSGCGYCAGRKVLVGFNDMATTHPHLAAELDDDVYSATDITAGAFRKLGWKCSEGHTWVAYANSRKKGAGCPYCSGRKPTKGETDLFSVHPSLLEEYDDSIDPNSLTKSTATEVWWKCKSGHRWKTPVYVRTKGSGCPRCRSRVSRPEQELYDWFVSICPDAEQSHSVERRELDIYSPKHNFGIEFNGLYWHSEAHVDKNYHKDKLDYFAAAGIRVVFVWEDDWLTRPDVVKKMLAAKLLGRKTVGARKTQVSRISYAAARGFLNANHIQGSASGTDYIGLTYDEDLVAVMVVKCVDGVANLVRYASTVGVSGGMDKMMRFAGYRDWVTFADHCVSDGGLYANTGWKADKVIPPDYKYLDGGRRVHKFNYRIKNFEKDKGFIYEPGMSESQLAKLNGVLRVYDAGKTRFTKTL